MTQLEEAELLFRTGAPPDARYTFKHALVQDTAYESRLKSRRQILPAASPMPCAESSRRSRRPSRNLSPTI
jgi:hypothetical protein